MKSRDAIQRLEALPKVDLGFFPTPLHRLNRLSAKYGVDLYMKRDDLSGPEFGGNKIRKLTFLLGDALRKGAEYVFTFGAHQSNHARETAAACRRCGLKPVLYLVCLAEGGRPRDCLGNLLLDKVLGAEIHYITPEPGVSAYESVERSYLAALQQVEILEKAGHRCYVIPVGGLDPVGCIGFLWGFAELAEQLEKRNLALDYIVHATGSGGTLAGLLAGKKLRDAGVRILAFSVDREPPGKREAIAEMANRTLTLLGGDGTVAPAEVNLVTDYYGKGYEIPSPDSTAAMNELALEEGIILDPVYTAKAMAGLLDYVRKGVIPKGSKVLFWHTGGTPAIFAEPEIVWG
ncbi:MAG: D-cysteine desulfhydrase family protein [Bacillota bacterium]|nr:D-cysteine desulfhydrase family protein [Bacillota bacterium]